MIDGAHRRGFLLSPECKSVDWPGYFYMVLPPDCPFNVLYYLAHSGNSADVNSSTRTSFLAKVGQARIAFLAGVTATKLWGLVDHSWGHRTSVFDAYAVGKLAQNQRTWELLKVDEGRTTPLWPPVFWRMPLLQDMSGLWLDKLVQFVSDAVAVPPALPEGTVEIARAGKGRRAKAVLPEATITGGPINLRGTWGGKAQLLKNVLVAASYLLHLLQRSLTLDKAGIEEFPFTKSIIPPKTARGKKDEAVAAKWNSFVTAVEQARLSLDDDGAYKGHLNDAAQCVREHLEDCTDNWHVVYSTQMKAGTLTACIREMVPRMPVWTALRALGMPQEEEKEDDVRGEGLCLESDSLLLSRSGGASRLHPRTRSKTAAVRRYLACSRHHPACRAPLARKSATGFLSASRTQKCGRKSKHGSPTTNVWWCWLTPAILPSATRT